MHHLDQLIIVKSVLTTALKTENEKCNNESAIYQDSAINLDEVYKRLNKPENQKKLFELSM